MLTGIGVSPGVAIGKVFLLDSDRYFVPERKLSESEIADEISRFRQAVEQTKQQLMDLKTKVEKEIGATAAEIFATHLMLLEDPSLIQQTIERIRQDKTNAEYLFTQVLQKMIAVFAKMEDEYLRERATDLRDVGRRVISNLLGKERETLAKLEEEVIVVAYDLAPSDTASMVKEKVIGFATDTGSRTSHTAIMARALEIPAVVGLGNITASVKSGDTLIVDGSHGVVIVNPDPATLAEYQEKQRRYILFERELEKIKGLPAETTDGYRVTIAANIELPEEIEHVKKHGADGVGLYRTEFLYMNRPDFPSEEEQFEAYRVVAESLAPQPVIIRTIDLGGDKFISQLDMPAEMNPFLGCRAIRFCLERPDVFKTQLRAIVRASMFGSVKIMFPMISGVKELRAALSILDETKRELAAEGVEYDQNLQVGVMIEIPSAAMTADILAKEVDFFSIGTNDLIQYTLAVDRVNERIAHLYDPLHPAILRFIKWVIDAGHNAGIWVGMCGEMASDPMFTMILLGLGLDEFSMGPVAIPGIKKIIRSVSMQESKELARTVFNLSTADEIREYLQRRVSQILPELV
ncbi:MAG: phosphoenolpyruvate--protein phosphotransferase [bacterium]|nr:phosphoenolpyruvate--protein phosphotransferase [bacterium]